MTLAIVWEAALARQILQRQAPAHLHRAERGECACILAAGCRGSRAHTTAADTIRQLRYGSSKADCQWLPGRNAP